MRLTAWVVLITLGAGCADTYLARPEAITVGNGVVGNGVVVATRERDGAVRSLRGESVEPIGTRDGAIRLGGRRRHPARWKAGLAFMIVGGVLSVVGVALALASLSGGCDLTEHPCDAEGAELIAGSAIGAFGDALGAVVGPAVFVAGNRSPVEELPAPAR